MAKNEHSPPVSADVPLVVGSLGHRPELDGIRGLAILLVFLVHFRFRTTGNVIDSAVDQLFRAGWMGVDLFFVLSGLLITGVLLETKSSKRYFRNFYVRRVLRLFPVYYGMLAILFIVLPRVLSPAPAELLALTPHQGWYWTYTVNVFQVLTLDRIDYFNTLHLWSLSVEEQFYLIWPFAVWWLSPRWLLRVSVVAVLAAVGFRILSASQGNDWAAYVLVPARMDALAIGALIAVLARDSTGSALIRRWWRRLALISAGTIGAIAIAQSGYREDEYLVLTAGFLVNAVLAAATIGGLLAEPRSGVHRPFHWRWLQWVGQRSYGAYVYHLPLLLIVGPVKDLFRGLPPIAGSRLPAEVAWILGMACLTMAVAEASFRWLERPFLALKPRFT